VLGMPPFMRALAVVGTAAMVWVGGGIVLHGAEELGLPGPAQAVHHAALAVAGAAPAAGAALEWVVGAALAGVVGLVLGGAIVVAVHLVRPPGRAVGVGGGR